MEQVKQSVENLTDHAREYVESYLKLTVLKATDKATGFASVSMLGILVCFLTMCIFFFLGIGIALWLGEIMNNTKAGYFIVTGFYLVLTLLVIALRERLIFPLVRNFIIKKVYE